MKICLAPLAMREIQFETTLISVRMAVIKEATTEAAGEDAVLKRGFLHSAGRLRGTGKKEPQGSNL